MPPALVNDATHEWNAVGIGFKRLRAEDPRKGAPRVVVIEFDKISEINGEVLLTDTARAPIQPQFEPGEQQTPIGIAVVFVQRQLKAGRGRVVSSLWAMIRIRRSRE